jgi:hypothetical protein
VELKQTKQAKMRINRATKPNKSETKRKNQQKTKKSEIVLLQCFLSKVVSFGSTKLRKLAVLLFFKTTETSLFFLDSVKTSFCSSFGSLDMNRVS